MSENLRVGGSIPPLATILPVAILGYSQPVLLVWRHKA